MSWTDPTAGLADATTDIALSWAPAVETMTTICTLATEQRCALVPTTHPLADSHHIHFAQIVDDPVVALPATAGPLRELWIAQKHRSRPATIAAEATTADEAVEAVGAGLGIAILAHGNVELYCRPDTTAIPILDLPPAELLLCIRNPPTNQGAKFLAEHNPRNRRRPVS